MVSKVEMLKAWSDCYACYSTHLYGAPKYGPPYDAIRALIERYADNGPGEAQAGLAPTERGGETSTAATPGPSPAEVEEAEQDLAAILAGWRFHAGFPSDKGLAALATVRAALNRTVSREWVHIWATTFDEDIADSEKRITDMLRALGITVEEGK